MTTTPAQRIRDIDAAARELYGRCRVLADLVGDLVPADLASGTAGLGAAADALTRAVAGFADLGRSVDPGEEAKP